MQTDPIFYADQMNMYAYTGNDPVNKIDPSGLAGQCIPGPCVPNDSLKNELSINWRSNLPSGNSSNGADSEGTPKRFKIKIGGKDPTKNTVVTDGKCGMKTQFSSNNSPTTAPAVLGGVAVHEGQHIADINMLLI